MTYAVTQSQIFATGLIPDGFTGALSPVGFVYDYQRSRILAVHSSGYFCFVFLLLPATRSNEGRAMDALAQSGRVTNLRAV